MQTATNIRVLEGYLTTQGVADHFGVPVRSVLTMIRKGRLPAQKLGWVWLIHESQLPESWPPPPVA